jgi:hypothetical protein
MRKCRVLVGGWIDDDIHCGQRRKKEKVVGECAGKEGGLETEEKLSSEKSQRQVRKYDSNSKERGATRGLVLWQRTHTKTSTGKAMRTSRGGEKSEGHAQMGKHQDTKDQSEGGRNTSTTVLRGPSSTLGRRKQSNKDRERAYENAGKDLARRLRGEGKAG